MKRASALLIALLIVCSVPMAAFAATPPYESYIYNQYGYAVPTAKPYIFSQEVTGKTLGIGPIQMASDMLAGPDGNLYILDGGNEGKGARIIILNEKFELVRVIDKFSYMGKNETLNLPEGMFINSEGMIYVADTQNARIIICDTNGVISEILDNPNIDLVAADTPYMPSKLIVDKSGRLYVVAKRMNKGLLELSNNGMFISFFGAPEVTLSPLDVLQRAIAISKQERLALTKALPTEYNNVVVDATGFIYGTISSVDFEALSATFFTEPGDASRSAVALIRKLSQDGDDIMNRKGMYPPVGDLIRRTGGVNSRQTSLFNDIALGPDGTYSAVDAVYGRVFTYDTDGNLLFVFGNLGAQKGTFKYPSAILYYGEHILVLDQGKNNLQVFEKTDYGKAVLLANNYYYNGEYDASEKQWQEVLKYNSNMTFAYIGVGKALLRAGDYEAALESFRLADNRVYYSKALEEYLKLKMGVFFPVIFLSLIGIWLLFMIIKTVKKFKIFLNDGAKKVI